MIEWPFSFSDASNVPRFVYTYLGGRMLHPASCVLHQLDAASIYDSDDAGAGVCKRMWQAEKEKGESPSYSA